jgi:hypothetical protein
MPMHESNGLVYWVAFVPGDLQFLGIFDGWMSPELKQDLSPDTVVGRVGSSANQRYLSHGQCHYRNGTRCHP